MHPLARKILIAGAQFIPLFVLTVALYLAVFPFYERMTVGAANAVTQRLSPPTHIEIKTNATWRGYAFNPQEGQRQVHAWGKSMPHLVFLGLVILPALLLSSPAPFSRRLRMLGLALPSLFVIHVLTIAAMTRSANCLSESPGTFFCVWVLSMASVSGQVSAVALWALFTWRYWIDRTA